MISTYEPRKDADKSSIKLPGITMRFRPEYKRRLEEYAHMRRVSQTECVELLLWAATKDIPAIQQAVTALGNENGGVV